MDTKTSGAEVIKDGLFAQFLNLLQTRFMGAASELLVIGGPDIESCEKIKRAYLDDLRNPFPSIIVMKIEPGYEEAHVIEMKGKESQETI